MPRGDVIVGHFHLVTAEKKGGQTDKRKNKHLYQQEVPFSFYLYCWRYKSHSHLWAQRALEHIFQNAKL